MHFMRYAYNCICPDNIEELNHIIDHGEEITREEFISKVSQDDLKILETELGYSEDFPMENDWHISYWRSWYRGQEILYFVHSCIEHVFKYPELPISQTLQELKQAQKGYRTEYFSGSQVRDPAEVIKYEICSLGNTDIIEYVKTHYGLLRGYELTEDIEVLQINIDAIIKEIISYCSDRLGAKDLEAIWLTDYEYAKEFYNNGCPHGIDEYFIDNEHLILSDLDQDGALFIFKR